MGLSDGSLEADSVKSRESKEEIRTVTYGKVQNMFETNEIGENVGKNKKKYLHS